jgi:hypothetical protein
VERDKEEDGFAHQDGKRLRKGPLFGGARLTIEPGSDFPIGVIPFLVTENELRCSEDLFEQFQLYRVFDFSWHPRVYVLTGALSQTCRLEPVKCRALVVDE